LYVKLDLYNDSLGYEDEKNVTLDMYQINDYEYVGDVSSEKEVTSINISVYPMDLENEKVILEVE
jgi:hypothetical protein